LCSCSEQSEDGKLHEKKHDPALDNVTDSSVANTAIWWTKIIPVLSLMEGHMDSAAALKLEGWVKLIREACHWW
jgi:hypothetical protein